MKPTLGPDIHLLATMKDPRLYRDPADMVTALAQPFEQGGGTITAGRGQGLDLSAARSWA